MRGNNFSLAVCVTLHLATNRSNENDTKVLNPFCTSKTLPPFLQGLFKFFILSTSYLPFYLLFTSQM